MTVAACASDMMPTFTKPMTMTVVAPDDCIAAVPKAPIPTPIRRLLDTLEKRLLRRELLAVSRLEDIIWQATRKIPIPATRVRMAMSTFKNMIDVKNDYYIGFVWVAHPLRMGCLSLAV